MLSSMLSSQILSTSSTIPATGGFAFGNTRCGGRWGETELKAKGSFLENGGTLTSYFQQQSWVHLCSGMGARLKAAASKYT